MSGGSIGVVREPAAGGPAVINPIKSLYSRRTRPSLARLAGLLLFILMGGAASAASPTDAARLMTLVRDGSIDQLAAYLATPGADINARPLTRSNADKALLDYAAEQNQIAVATWLLDHGANVNGAQQQGVQLGLTALHRAALLNSLEVGQVLIAHGADVNARQFLGATPLLFAASAGYGRLINLLLQSGADIGATTTIGQSAVCMAAQQGHLDIVKLLEAHGASLNDEQALSEATSNQRTDIVRYLLEHHQSQRAKDGALRFAITAADPRSDSTSLELVSMLLAAGADVNNTGTAAVSTPLMLVKRPELRTLLLEHGARDAAASPGGKEGDDKRRTGDSGTGSDQLATIVATLGGNSPAILSQTFDMFAALQMRVIAPDDPSWNHSNPRWVALFHTVKQDLRDDAEPALEASLADAHHELAATLGARLSTDEVDRLLAFYDSAEGQRYIGFESELADIQAQGMSQSMTAAIGAATPPRTDAPSEERLNMRRRMLENSWGSMLVQEATSVATDQHSPEPGKSLIFAAMLGAVAKTRGPEIDALERTYGTDLARFEQFQASAVAKALLSALKGGFQQDAAQPKGADQFKAAIDHSVALHAASWKATYEAGRSNRVAPPQSGSADSHPDNALPTGGAPNVQMEQRGSVTSMTIPGQLASTQTLGCLSIDNVKSTAAPPDLYNASRACIDRGDYDDAVPLFLLGGAYGQFDGERVADKSAAQGVVILRMAFSDGLREDQRQAFNAAKGKVLASDNRVRLCAHFERLGPPNYFPQYMILHGINAFTTADPTADALVHGFDDAGTWRRILAEGLHCAAEGH